MAIDPSAKIVTNLQLRTALRSLGKFDDAVALVAMSDDFVKDAWDYANTFNYDNPLMISICAALEVDMDELFTTAFNITS